VIWSQGAVSIPALPAAHAWAIGEMSKRFLVALLLLLMLMLMLMLMMLLTACHVGGAFLYQANGLDAAAIRLAETCPRLHP